MYFLWATFLWKSLEHKKISSSCSKKPCLYEKTRRYLNAFDRLFNANTPMWVGLSTGRAALGHFGKSKSSRTCVSYSSIARATVTHKTGSVCYLHSNGFGFFRYRRIRNICRWISFGRDLDNKRGLRKTVVPVAGFISFWVRVRTSIGHLAAHSHYCNGCSPGG